MDLRPVGGHTSRPQITLVHGATTLNTLYWTPDHPDSFCLKMASTAGLRVGDLIAFGHTHKPWHREVEGIYFLNSGSVGKPKDGDWRAGYVLVDAGEEIGEIECGSNTTRRERWRAYSAVSCPTSSRSS
jgi:predicted phosphodiesterase